VASGPRRGEGENDGRQEQRTAHAPLAAKRAAPAPALASPPPASASADVAAVPSADRALALAMEIDRREAAGELSRSVRRAACARGDVEWAALSDRAGRVLKLSIRTPDGGVRTGWYDAEGALRRAVAPPSQDELRLPARDPAGAFAAASCPP
jgi:hypothetical protein